MQIKKMIFIISIILIIIFSFIYIQYSRIKKLYISKIDIVNNELGEYYDNPNIDIYNLTEIKKIEPFIFSRNINEINSTIFVLKNITDTMNQEKAIGILLDKWDNGFNQFSNDEKNLLKKDLTLLRIKLASALYNYNNKNEYLLYLINSSKSDNQQIKNTALEQLKNYGNFKNDNNLKAINKKDFSEIGYKDPINNPIDLDDLYQWYLTSEDHFIRMDIIDHLGNFRNNKVIKVLSDIYNDIDSTYSYDKQCEKIQTAVSLWKLGKDKYLDFIYYQVDHGSLEVRIQALILLGMVDIKKSRYKLISIISTENKEELITPALMSLALIGKNEDIKNLEMIKQRKNKNIQRNIDTTINKIKKKSDLP